MAVVAGGLSLVVLAALLASRTRTAEPVVPPPPQTSLPAERGDAALAQRLAERAAQVAGQDPRGALRLLLAAHVVVPDNPVHRIALAQALLGATQPVRVLRGRLDTGGPVRYAAVNSDASILVTGGATAGHLWQIAALTGPPRIRLATELNTPVTGAAGAGTLASTKLLLAGNDGVFVWRVVTPGDARRLGQVAGPVDALALTADGNMAITVEATTATLADVGLPRPVPEATLSYDQPVITVAFAPGPGLALAAGHVDGAVTIHTIDRDRGTTTKRSLTSSGGAVDAVALSADASTVVALHQDGTISVWDLRTDAAAPVGTVAAAAGKGPHRVWASGTGDYAFVADAAGPPALWSLAERGRPTRMLVLGLGADPAVPAMISLDGRAVATIDRTNTLTTWDIGPTVDVLSDPIARACQLADMSEQQWRQMVPTEAMANPCAAPVLPSLSVSNG